MAILMVNGMAANWALKIANSTYNKTTVRVDARFASAFCSDDTFYLKPGEIKVIDAGICNLESAHVDFPHGESWYRQASNPVGGLGIITINRGTKNEHYRVVPLERMKIEDRKMASAPVAQRG